MTLTELVLITQLLQAPVGTKYNVESAYTKDRILTTRECVAYGIKRRGVYTEKTAKEVDRMLQNAGNKENYQALCLHVTRTEIEDYSFLTVTEKIK